ncbi:hypothetical protein B5M47_02695 [candidate division CPR3 bacterium 4484_211]|uniref:Peptidase S11 D-alanyl-D-alanine carboxypeptidase A N-terminal domain-containing protein n=1 Tax=candidate division CPR3 bacterium 4484_211 TaxID=1968527 RepID=A0A1W9NXN2_UNCC3|nr:MAG: hypothetical protein B5M47_02695 [candidate division CPR3 bacterium 4484_211]
MGKFSLPTKLVLIFGFFSWLWLGVLGMRFCQLKDYRLPAVFEGANPPLSSSLWKPQIAGDSFNTQAIDFGQNVAAALSVNFDSGEVYYALNIHQRLPIASLTKVMTALVALEYASLDKEITVPAAAMDLPKDSSVMGISAGEVYPVKDLLYGLLLPSGNDAAKTLAIGVLGSEENFVYRMNRRSQSLGLKDTHFGNSSGLDDPWNYSSVYDLAVLTHYVLVNYPVINQIVGEKQYEIPYTEKHKYLFLGNFNDLMLLYEGVDGVKPGNTEAAGSCLIASATRGDRRVMALVLGSTYRNAAAIKLLDLGFSVLPSPG